MFRKERRLRVFWKRVLRRIFEPKRGEVRGDWRKSYSGTIFSKYYSADQIKMVEMGGECSTYR